MWDNTLLTKEKVPICYKVDELSKVDHIRDLEHAGNRTFSWDFLYFPKLISQNISLIICSVQIPIYPDVVHILRSVFINLMFFFTFSQFFKNSYRNRVPSWISSFSYSWQEPKSHHLLPLWDLSREARKPLREPRPVEEKRKNHIIPICTSWNAKIQSI